jgi:hypothetical protein
MAVGSHRCESTAGSTNELSDSKVSGKKGFTIINMVELCSARINADEAEDRTSHACLCWPDPLSNKISDVKFQTNYDNRFYSATQEMLCVVLGQMLVSL